MGKKEVERLKLELIDLNITLEEYKKRGDEIFMQRNLLMHFFVHMKAVLQQCTINAVVNQQKKRDNIEGEVDKYLFIQNVHSLIGFFSKLYKDAASTEIYTPPSQEFYEAWLKLCTEIYPEIEANKKKIRETLSKLIPKTQDPHYS